MRFKASGPSDFKIDLLDRIARRVITLGGFTTIFAVAAMISFICYEAFPLLLSPSISDNGSWQLQDRLQSKTLSIGTDEYRESGYRLSRSGSIDFVRLGKEPKGKFHLSSKENEELSGDKLTASYKVSKTGLTFYGTDSGKVGFVDVKI